MKKILINENNIGFYEKDLIDEYNKNLDDINSSITLNTEKIIRNKNIISELNELDTLNEDIMFEMANFKKEKSGLDFNIWIDDAGDARTNKHHKPRIKVQDPDDSKNLVSISISKSPEILAGRFKKNQNLSNLLKFIENSYTDLIKVWHQEIDAVDFINKYRIK